MEIVSGVATIKFLQIKANGNEERRITCRQLGYVDNTFCQRLHSQVRTCQRICKHPALRLSIADRSDTAHDIDETNTVISFSTQNKMTRSTLLTSQMIQEVSAHSSPSRRAADRSGTTQTFGARLTVEAVSSIANSHSAEIDTPSVIGLATLPSSQELAITDSTHDVANELLHGGFIHSFMKILHCLISGLINLSASKDVSMHF